MDSSPRTTIPVYVIVNWKYVAGGEYVPVFSAASSSPPNTNSNQSTIMMELVVPADYYANRFPKVSAEAPMRVLGTSAPGTVPPDTHVSFPE